MKCTIPEISWHNRDPVLSIDIQPIVKEETYRLASGGADSHLLIWHLKVLESGAVTLDLVADLIKHQKAVNVVRWSPTGQFLASGDDEATIIIWNLKTDNIPLLEGENKSSDKEIWVVNKILRGHKEDVYDICWSPNGLKLVSGSIDNTAILWDITKGYCENILTDHKGFVQGVAWDPKGQCIATLSSDRVCRIFDNTGKAVKSRTSKGILPVPESHSLYNKEVKYFHDDTFKSYFRRLSFSCDGNLLFLPSGCIDIDNSKTLYATYVFTLDQLTLPAAILPSPKQITIATRCCPVLFELHRDGPDPIIDLPYRMIVAVASDRDVCLYDTQQLLPIAHFHRLHYTRITDLTWSPNGLLLLASSTDGFCTCITFEKSELGVEYTKDQSEEDVSIIHNSPEQENVTVVKKPNILEQWAVKTPKDFEENGKTKPMPIAVRKEPRRAILTKIGDVEKKPVNQTGSGSNVQITGKDCSGAEDVNTTNKFETTETVTIDVGQKHDNSKHTNVSQKSSPVKLEVSPLFKDGHRTNNNINKLQTPKSSSRFNKSIDNTSNSSSSKRRKKDTKKAQMKNSTLFKFLKQTVKSIKDDRTTTSCANAEMKKIEATESDTVIEIEDSNDGYTEVTNIETAESDTLGKEDVIDIDRNDGIISGTEHISEQINGDITSVQGKHTELKLDVTGTSKNNVSESSHSNGNQSPSSKILPKPARRVQLVTLSSPKRKKQD